MRHGEEEGDGKERERALEGPLASRFRGVTALESLALELYGVDPRSAQEVWSLSQRTTKALRAIAAPVEDQASEHDAARSDSVVWRYAGDLV